MPNPYGQFDVKVNTDVPSEACAKASESDRERLQKRALHADREKFLAVLANVPDIDPDDRDRF